MVRGGYGGKGRIRGILSVEHPNEKTTFGGTGWGKGEHVQRWLTNPFLDWKALFFLTFMKQTSSSSLDQDWSSGIYNVVSSKQDDLRSKLLYWYCLQTPQMWTKKLLVTLCDLKINRAKQTISRRLIRVYRHVYWQSPLNLCARGNESKERNVIMDPALRFLLTFYSVLTQANIHWLDWVKFVLDVRIWPCFVS